LAAPCGFALSPTELPSNYIANHWDTENGLPHNAIKAIFQTRDGYIWVGTQQGLVRFDGLTFTVFTQHNTPSFPNNQITSFAETSDGSLWIGTSFGLARYQNGRFTSYGRANGLKSDTINAVCVAPDGSLWVGGQEGITRWVNGKFVNDVDTSGYEMRGLRSIVVDHQKAIWLSVGSDAIRYASGKLTRFGRAAGLPAEQLQMICEDNIGRILAVTQNGIFRLDEGRFVPLEQSRSFSSQIIHTALTDRAGNLWVGSVNGLDRYTGGTATPYIDRSNGKLTVVDVLFEDREGSLWIGSSAGLFRLTDRRASTLSPLDGLTGTLAVAVTQTRDGAVWISTWAGGVDRFLNGVKTHYTQGAPLSQMTITAIYQAPDGTIWLGNRASSLDRLEGNKVTTFVYQSGVVSSRPVTALYAAPDGEFLIGISRRGLLELRDGQILPAPEAAEFGPETIWTLNRLHDGRMLMGTSKGLYERSADRRWHAVPLRGMPEPVVVRALLEDNDGTIWLATDGQGLVRWAHGEARAYDVRAGMVDDTLFSVVADDVGSLWVSSARGIARIRRSEIADFDRGALASLNCLTFGRADGLLSASSNGNGTPAAVCLADGRIMTATDNGVAVIAPQSLQTNSRPPTVVIENVVADDRRLPLGDAVTVPPGTNRLEIRYNALSLIAPERLRFRYQLEGSDPRWVEALHERTAHYTHLSPGHYRFRVVACNNDGVWSDVGATLAITMRPYFFQTWWFRCAVIVLALALLAAGANWRLRQLTRRQQLLAEANVELDQRVRTRTAQLSKSNSELQQRESLFRLIFEHAPLGISWHRTDLGSDYHFNSAFRRILDLPADTLPDNSLLIALVHPEDARRQAELDALVQTGQLDRYALEQRFVRKDGRLVWGAFAAAVVRDAEGEIIQMIGILEDITATKEAEQKLTSTYQRLVDTSRLAGMAEVATGVLHNVGNVLNSVNVSAALLMDRLRQSRISAVAKLGELLRSHESDLPAFLAQDPRGRQVPGFVDLLSVHLTEEQAAMLKELESLRKNIEHIKEIVAMQQGYAKISGVTEIIGVAEIVEDALRMSSDSFARHQVTIIRDFRERPTITVEKHKVLQILVNLLRNAKYACDESGCNPKEVTVRISAAQNRVTITITDNGIGIPEANLTQIFAHGFTTRKSGHGFGLHNSAIGARELGGSLTASSAGYGRGASFALELPLQPASAESNHA
jgi:PAS domain S-box-containing protein